MKVLWAPWRMEYILGEDKPPGCIFCPEPGENLAGAPGVVQRPPDPRHDEQVSLYQRPSAGFPPPPPPGLDDLTPAETLDLMSKVRESIAILKRVMHPDGFNVGLNLGLVAGAGVESHLHFHIVPRWAGDTNFIPVFAEVRVIPEHFRQTYERLAPLLPGPAR